MYSKTLLVSAALLIAPAIHAADLPTAQASAPSDLASLLEGEFTTLPPPIEQPQAPQSQNTAMYTLAKRVDMPTLGRYVVYAELRKGARDGQLLRERIYALDPDLDNGRIRMKTFAPADMKALDGAYANPGLLSKIQLSDLKQFPTGCEMLWHKTDAGFAGDIATSGCSAAVAAHLTVSREGMSETQQAFGNSGSSAEVNKPMEFRRLR